MKKWLKVVGAVAVFLGVAASASGDSNTYNYQGSGPYFNTKNGAVVDASGNAKVVDATPPYSLARTWTVLDDKTLASAAADSCVPIALTGKLYSITVKCVATNFATATPPKVRLAISVRNHIAGLADSLNTSNFYPLPLRAVVAGDTTTVGQTLAGGTSSPWSGEFVFQFDSARLGPNGTTALFPYPNAVTYMFSSIYGTELYAQYASVRVRNLSITSAPSVRVWVWVTEVPL